MNIYTNNCVELFLMKYILVAYITRHEFVTKISTSTAWVFGTAWVQLSVSVVNPSYFKSQQNCE